MSTGITARRPAAPPPSAPDVLVREYERVGFVSGGRVLERAELDVLTAELERYIDALFRKRDHGLASPTYWADASHHAERPHLQITDLWKVSQPFRRLVESPLLAGMAARLARAATLQIWSDTAQYKPAHEGGAFQWHQDAPYHKSTSPSTRLVTAWIALDDSDQESGCMWMVPGSHRWGDQTDHLEQYCLRAARDEFVRIDPPLEPDAAIADWKDPVPVPVRAGEVHFHHGYTWHGSPANRSGRRRAGYTIFYMPEGVVATDYPDPRITVPPGTPMIEAGANFPVVYRRPASAVSP